MPQRKSKSAAKGKGKGKVEVKRKQAGSRKQAPSPVRLMDPPQFEGTSSEGKIVGSLVAIVERTVEGWALNVQDPTKPVTVDIFDGERLLGNAAAFMFRPELSAAGIGNGNHYFQFALPDHVFDGDVHVICARAALSALEAAVGVLENVSDDGWVKGWAWYPGAPGDRVAIEVLVDGDVVGVTPAATHRSDLLAAGIGDGNCSFSFGLPLEVVRRARGSLVSIRDKRSGKPIAEPRLFQRREIVDALAQLDDLENDTRLLNSTVALAADRVAADNRAAADLFRTVGDFFSQLAEVTAAGKPPATLQTLGAAINHVTRSFAPVELDLSAEPEVSICVEAIGSLDNIYSVLRSLSALRSEVQTEVVLYHSGACDEAALLPLVVRNLRYFHPEAGLNGPELRNRVAEFARGENLVFIAGFAEPMGDWLDAIVSAFRADRDIALIGAKIVRADGVVESADAIVGDAFAVRRDAWNQHRGLDESTASAQTALVDLFARVAAADDTIVYEPNFEVVLRR